MELSKFHILYLYAVQNTKNDYSALLKFLHYFMFYTYWLTYDHTDNDQLKIETCWRRNLLIKKLHIGNVHLVVNSKIICGVFL